MSFIKQASILQETVRTAHQGAYMVGLTLSAFRTKVSRLGIKGKKDGRNVFYTLAEIAKINKQNPAQKRTKVPPT
jgi:hypothetical protein